MNCKPGDTAEYVGKDFPELRGQRMVCVRLNTATHSAFGNEFTRPNWIVDPPMQWPDDDMGPTVADDVLRPIRAPGEGATDEMVALLGKPASQPSKETA